MAHGFSIIGFILGAICALIFYAVATSLVVFTLSGLIFGLIALLLWGWLTFSFDGLWARRGHPRV